MRALARSFQNCLSFLIFLAFAALSQLATPEIVLASAKKSAHHHKAEVPERVLTPVRKLASVEQTEIAPASKASFHYRLQPGVDCTGTYISNKGHFLTALHCVAGCLAKHRAIQRSHASDEPVKVVRGREIYTDLMTVDEDKIDEGLECPVSIGNRKLTAKIILTGGKGWLAPKDTIADFAKRFPEDHKALLAQGYEHGFDFAILQVESLKTSACLPLARRAPAQGEKLAAISYSCLNRDDLYTDGKTALFTSGQRTAGFKTSEFFRTRGAQKLPFRPELIDGQPTFFSSLDIEKCGSGSGIFDSHSQLAGIATRVYKDSTNYEYGSVEAVDVAQVWKELNAKTSGSMTKEITNCSSASRPRR